MVSTALNEMSCKRKQKLATDNLNLLIGVLLLGDCFALHSFLKLCYGARFPLSFGVFQNYYSKLPEFSENPYVSVVGTVASGISYLGAPLTAPFIKRYQRFQRQMIWVGWPICIVALVSGSFASTLETLILTQGVAYGLGFLIFYYPILNMVNEFWISRRGMAYGILCGASGISGAVMPFVMEKLLNTYGYRTTLRAVALALFTLTGPLIPFLKGRLPASRHTIAAKADWRFLKTPLFWTYTFSNVAQGLGYFYPSLYLPSYATSMGLSNFDGALLLALMSISQVMGQLTFGFLSDRRFSVNTLITLSSIAAAVASLTLWGFAHSLAPLIAFALVYGFFGAGYTAMWARMSTSVSADPTVAPIIFSLFCFGKGIGNVLTGPLSGNLILPTLEPDAYGLTRYMALVALTGGCMALSAVSICSWYMSRWILQLR
ncbi:major facilitator superfamily domain-containing protein [Penicillium canariense]|uniref:Major facilitator superfamily domain-containing protein n=1 Tax=Penicillium canariense TaxID=189055 RepID=A0A9W9I786_9EURO|nr:major facilitator superfamily domain-containing protein [Penicillium canariense]KAJ5169191.1 major facilitator superfamily domain-containing protein [Penicillium canariense]